MMASDHERYQFIKAHFVQSHSPHMDGTSGYRFRGGWPALIGRTFDEAIDAAMREVELQAETDHVRERLNLEARLRAAGK